MEQYTAWIAEYLKGQQAGGYGKCKEATLEMVASFPELKQVLGHVHTSWGKRGHAWCVAPDGTIVDPTAAQFPVLFEYEPWNPGDEIRVGKCMNCGDEIWRKVDNLLEAPHLSICNEECENEMMSYLNG